MEIYIYIYIIFGGGHVGGGGETKVSTKVKKQQQQNPRSNYQQNGRNLLLSLLTTREAIIHALRLATADHFSAEFGEM